MVPAGCSAIQMAMLIAAFPFAILMIFMCISLIKVLRSEHGILQMERKQREHDPEFREKQRKELRRMRKGFEEALPDAEDDREL
ncbi:BCCT family transporter [Lentibacillus sp. CBA3610]|uniref:BCCT family transporter n=1 Tax=Lentibacillus sp. CBA3610 TaxID=2518176 RepID=UPI0020D226A3|nr:BCCT family transporter [Lentibacillus sp. CBA3610]